MCCRRGVKGELGETHMQIDGEPWRQGLPAAGDVPLRVRGAGRGGAGRGGREPPDPKREHALLGLSVQLCVNSRPQDGLAAL